MRIQTPRETRRAMVGRISERLGIPARYNGAPGFSYAIGEITVERDGSVVSGNDALLESLIPMLAECGWLEAAQQPGAQAEDDSQAGVPDAGVERMDITTPLRDWTAAERLNLLRMLYGRQFLLNRMMRGGTLYIEETFIAATAGSPPTCVADFEAHVREGIKAGRVRGVAFEDGQLIFSVPCRPEEAGRWTVYCELLDGILRSAKAAKRVFPAPRVDSESEKYHANSWLVRMGFSGPEYKELRQVLTRHLNGYAAFKSAAGMRAHSEKCAARRREKRGITRAGSENEDREALK